MNFVITMAGEGKRFADAGYTLPKMLIPAKGKTLLEWSIDSLPLDICSHLICVVLDKHDVGFSLCSEITRLYEHRVPKISFIRLPAVTGGQAESVLTAKSVMDMEKELLIYNIDTAFHSDTLREELISGKGDGVLGAFHSSENKFSYAQIDEHGFVTQTAEKIVISEYALNGLYHFRDTPGFLSVAEKSIHLNVTHQGEFYIAPMYNDLIAQGKKFTIDMAKETFILGTPEQLNDFLHEG